MQPKFYKTKCCKLKTESGNSGASWTLLSVLGMGYFPRMKWGRAMSSKVHVHVHATKTVNSYWRDDRCIYIVANNSEMYPGFQIWGSSGPLFEKFGGPLQNLGGPAN